MSTHPGFVGKCVLAPMVRTGELATRLVSLKYGADAVWGRDIKSSSARPLLIPKSLNRS